MRKTIHLFLFICIATKLSAQDFTGQWKGEFIDKSTSFSGWGGDHCEYVLELECSGSKVTGYSYTYFSDGGKRYYTICKLSGTLNKESKYIEVKETERTKTNVPITIRNCFQIHRLTYYKHGDEQSLEGTWVPVPNQQGDCGFGSTVLSRRVMQKNPAYYNDNITKSTPANKPRVKKATEPLAKPTPKIASPAPIAKATPKKQTRPDVKKEAKPNSDAPFVKSQPEKQPKPAAKVETGNSVPVTPPVIKTEAPTGKILIPEYKKRDSELLKTIEIDSASFTVDLYDNGEIDGDSISLFFNGNLILSHKRLSDKAIRLKLDVDRNRNINELIMYAENLGTIPPNTALMVVNDGYNRYEVRISSDLEKSGVIRFVYKPAK